MKNTLTMTLPSLLAQLKPRPDAAHKGSMGHVAIIGGDDGMAGAAILAAQAAIRIGAGKTSLLSRAQTLAALLIRQPEVMCVEVDDDTEMDLSVFDVLAIGPGLGQKPWAQQLLALTGDHQGYQVWDADALNLLALQAQHGECHQHAFRVLTPHPAEAARLLNSCTAEVQADRVTAVLELQRRYGGVVVLKGAQTLIAYAEEGRQQVFLCPYGNAGMASGGMGDVLSGLIAGLLAQKDIHAAGGMLFCVQLAVCLHSYGADEIVAVEGQRGLLASDIIGVARRLLNNMGVQKISDAKNL